MHTFARMKKFIVDNRIDKEGRPDPIIQLQVEMVFRENLARELAGMTNGEQIVLTMEPNQKTIPFEPADGDATRGEAAPQANPNQLLLLPASAVEDAESEEVDSSEADLANVETVDLIKRHADAMADLREAGEDDQDGDITAELEAVVRELYSRGLVLQEANADGTFKWIDQETGEVVGANDDAVAAASE